MSDDSFFGNAIWDRQHDYQSAEISRKLYMLLICGWTAIGIAFSAAMSYISQGWDVNFWGGWGYLVFALAVLGVSLIGTTIADSSDNWLISAFGYALVAGPFGLLLGPFVAMYETSSVVKIFALTSGVVLILGLVGVFIPDDLSSWATPLFGALLLLIGGYFIVPLLGLFGIPTESGMTALDWIGLVIFGALVIYDLNRASRLAYTVDNAVDSAVAIYLDFINIFIRLLSLMGQMKD